MGMLRDGLVPLILAGGRGTRIAHLHSDLPKPAIRVAGRPFIAWILGQLHEAGFRKAVISSQHLGDVLERETVPFIPTDMEIVWVREPKPLGTAGGMAHAARESGLNAERWLVMNGDSYLGGEWPRSILENRGALLVSRWIEEVGRYGSLEVQGGRLRAILEKGARGPGLINAGIYAIPGEWMETLPDDAELSLEKEILPVWLKEGKVIRIIEELALFLDIGTPDSLAMADQFIQKIEHSSRK